MGEGRRAIAAAAVSSVLLVLFFPNTLIWVERAGERAVGVFVDSLTDPAAQPLIVGVSLLALLVLSFVIIFGVVRVFTSVGAQRSSGLAKFYESVTPDSPQSKGLMFMLIFTVVFFVGLTMFVPWLADSLDQGDEIDRVFRDIEEGQYSGNLETLFADDAVPDTGPTVSYRNENDTDGDGLPDTWERLGRTPNGVRLDDADPERMDLYVQVNYGENATALSNGERQRLREIWASMPVENPDGSTGIDLHLVTRAPGAGRLQDPVIVDRKDQVDGYYTRDRLLRRYCVHTQVVLGEIVNKTDIGYAETPGRAVVLESRRFADYEGSVPFRTAMITHGLLHTVVGEVDGDVHSNGGWLDYPRQGNEGLSRAVVRKLQRDGFSTTQAYSQECAAVIQGG